MQLWSKKSQSRHFFLATNLKWVSGGRNQSFGGLPHLTQKIWSWWLIASISMFGSRQQGRFFFFRSSIFNGFVSSRYYAAPLAPYYLQLEDDINFAPNWISHITGAKGTNPVQLTYHVHDMFSFLTSYIGNTKFWNKDSVLNIFCSTKVTHLMSDSVMSQGSLPRNTY